MLLLAALLIVILVPLVSGVITQIVGYAGDLFAALRDLIDGGGQNYVVQLGAIISFLLFMLILKFIVGFQNWRDVLWVSLVGLFLLYCLYSAIPEVASFGF